MKQEEKIYQLLEEHDKAMSMSTLSNAKNQIRASTKIEMMKVFKEWALEMVGEDWSEHEDTTPDADVADAIKASIRKRIIESTKK